MLPTSTTSGRNALAALCLHVEALTLRLGSGEHGGDFKARDSGLTDGEARQASAHLFRLQEEVRHLRTFCR
jgi:hypothetical protein